MVGVPVITNFFNYIVGKKPLEARGKAAIILFISGDCYQIIKEPQYTWDEAEIECKKLDPDEAHLASINSEDDNAFVLGYLILSI